MSDEKTRIVDLTDEGNILRERAAAARLLKKVRM